MPGQPQPLFTLPGENEDIDFPPAPASEDADSTTEQIEVEVKFTVPNGTPLPNLTQIGRLGRESISDLNALYFDTPDLALLRGGIALRRRSGGSDSGWHLKVRTASAEQRREVHAPIAGARPPWSLREALPSGLREAPLIPVARMITKRREIPVLSDRGRVLATICLDDVDVELSPLGPRAAGDRGPRHISWREVEVELDEDDRRVLTHLSRVLTKGGLEPAPYSSKIARALEHWPKVTLPAGAHRAVQDYASHQVGVIQTLEEGVLAGEEEAIHRSRVAARRLRSTIGTFSLLFPNSLGVHLISELRWYGLVLSASRDAQVLRQRFGADPDVDVAGRTDLDPLLTALEEEAVESTRADLLSPRYELLQDLLAELIDPGHHENPVEWATSDEAILGALAFPYARTASRLRQAMRVWSEASKGRERGEDVEHLAAWHRVRKTAKAVRYGYEALAGEDDQVTRAWTGVTKTLGQIQDCAAACDSVDALLGDPTRPSGAWRDGLEKIRESEVATIGRLLPHAEEMVVRALGISLGGGRFGDKKSIESEADAEPELSTEKG